MSQVTGNTQAFIENEQYSSFLLENLHDSLLPVSFYRNVTDFGSGETLRIKTIGKATLQEVEEDTPLIYNAIDTGEVTLQITDYKGDAWSISRKLRQDGSMVERLLAERSVETARAFAEDFETRLFEVVNGSQTPNDQNLINGFAHRRVASGTNATVENSDLIQMKLAFDKANVPLAGRIAVVDPVVAASLLQKYQGTYNVDSNPTMQALLEQGFTRDHEFVMNLFGWNVFISNFLPQGISETIDSVSVTDGVANVFMSILDDQTRPVMYAERQPITSDTEFNKDRQRDEFIETWRYGLGIQRNDTIGVILSSATDL